MTESSPDQNQFDHGETSAASSAGGDQPPQECGAGSALSPESSAHPADLASPDSSKHSTRAPADKVVHPPSESEIEAHKRLGNAEPGELAYALKQVFNGGEEKPPQSKLAAAKAETVLATALFTPGRDIGGNGSPGGEAKSGYDNPFALFADVFYGMLVAPRATLTILSDSKRFPPTAGNLILTLVLVIGALALPAAIKAGANNWSAIGWIKSTAFITGNLCNWCILATILYYLGIWLRGNKLTPGNALIATGWAYLPFAFFAPVVCFKSAMGGGFAIFAGLPALWFLLLEWFAFQVSLRTSTVKLALIAFVVPPIFCLVYFFWIGLAVVALIAQLVSHLA